MKSRLEKILAQLEKELDKAEKMADSEHERTAEKYADVSDNLNTAIEEIEEAITLLEA